MKFLTKALFAAGAALGGGAAALNACVVARTAPAVRRLSDLDGRSADAILVLGAGVEPDGRMSDMLADRVEVAIALYRRGAGSCCSAATAGRDTTSRRPCAAPFCGRAFRKRPSSWIAGGYPPLLPSGGPGRFSVPAPS